ncbi:hypothetical protein JCM10212_000387 [Sporobolomyces blumeae]
MQPVRAGPPSPLRLPSHSLATSPSPLSPSPSPSVSTPVPTPLVPLDLDYSFLTSTNFTTEADWLNSIVDDVVPAVPPPSLHSLESTLSRTLHSLEVHLTDTSALVDRSISDISLSVPRLAFDLQLMRENALLLRFTLDGIRKRGGGFGLDSQVGQVMERIKVLDLVKTRMEAARDVLREAESWSTLESEVTGLVGEGQFLKAAERLAEAARSMVVFQNTAEYEGRRALMVSLQNELEASLSSGLVKAITERDVKGCKTFWSIFGMIQREQEYRSYYFGSRRSGLVEGWTSAKLVDCVDETPSIASSALLTSTNAAVPTSIVTSARLTSPGPQKFSAFLSHFYSELYSLLTEERTYLPAIFPDPVPTLSSFIQTTLEGLSPSFPQRLTSITDSYGSRVLPEIIAAFKATEEFAVQVEHIFAKLEPPAASLPANAPSPSSPTPPSPSRPSHSPSLSSAGPPQTPTKRRLLKRKSLSKRLSSRSISYALGSSPDFVSSGVDGEEGDVDDAHSSHYVRAWETALFEPFLDLQVEYPTLERQFLASEVSRALGDASEWVEQVLSGVVGSQGGSEKGPKYLLDSTTRLFAMLEEAIGRNLALTHGYGAKGLVKIMEEMVVAFVDRRKEDLVRVSRQRGTIAARRRAQQNAGNGSNGTAGIGSGSSSLLGDDEPDVGLEGLEYSAEDWGTFQFGLRLLETCRAMSERLGGFEGRLKSRMTVLAHSVRQARENPATFTIPGTTRGEILLLRQSTLNSAELATMLDSLEGGPNGATTVPFLLPRAKTASVDFTRTTQLFLHETILAPLLVHLNDYASLACWTSTSDRPGGKGAFDLSIPTFSLSPTETISRVGEGLFNLPRLFEVYAQDDALAYSIETLPFVDLESLRALAPHIEPSPMLRQSSSNGPGHRPTLSEVAVGGSSSSSAHHHSSSSRSHRGPSISQLPPPPPVPTEPLSAETAIATWLSSLTLSVLSHLTTRVLPSLNRLSKHGANQLASDLDYISNVARALDVESPDDLESWREAISYEDRVLKEGGSVSVGSPSTTGETSEVRVDRTILEKVAKIRGFRRGST